jgi:hypothetical protein
VSRISRDRGRKRLAGQRVARFGWRAGRACAGGGGIVALALCSFGKKGLGRLTIAPALGRGARRSGVRGFVGVEVAAEGRVLISRSSSRFFSSWIEAIIGAMENASRAESERSG